MAKDFEREAQRVESLLPSGPRVGVLGSTGFWHPESERLCTEIGRGLAAIPGLVLLTGGVEGVGETVGRSFFQARQAAGKAPGVYHLLPLVEEPWDYGVTFFAGADMSERREILARLSLLFLVVEGGAGTVHEAQVATSRNATIIPVGRSGGHAGVLHAHMQRPAALDEATWLALATKDSTPEAAAAAAILALSSCLERS